MLAPNPTPETNPPAPKPAEKKRRTITLTNRAPISIVEMDWPIIAESKCGEDAPDGAPLIEWEITFRYRLHRHGSAIVYAGYSYSNELDETYQKARVGRVLNMMHTDEDLWKAILETGEELRERIGIENLRKHVRGVVDRLFAELPAHGFL